jgi:hypothetical protein
VRNRPMGSILLLVVLAFSSRVLAQRAEQSGAAKPQTAAPTPDLSGVWARRPSTSPTPRSYAYGFIDEEPPMQPWAEAKYKAAKPSYGPHAVPDPDDPTFKCFPPGVPRVYAHPVPMEIVQVPGRVIVLFEYDHYVRQIYTDGREHNKDLPPLWMGDSIGRWNGDTLVVDTTGFNDKTWLDRAGHPHSDALHLVERIRRLDHNTLEIDLTIDDPKAYTRPWGGQLIYQLEPGWNLMEMVCADTFNSSGVPKKETPIK